MRKVALMTAMIMGLATPAMASHMADGAGHDIIVKVNGLVCDFCAQSITALFQKQDGVTGVGVDLSHGLVTLDLSGEKKISDDVIKKLMTDSGYTVTDIKHAGI